MLKLMVMMPLAWMTVLLTDGGEGADDVTAQVSNQSLRRTTCKVYPPTSCPECDGRGQPHWIRNKLAYRL